jgi:DNA processing protein
MRTPDAAAAGAVRAAVPRGGRARVAWELLRVHDAPVCGRGGTAAVRVLERGGPGYPDSLLALADAPARLFVRGGALPACAEAVAIVGTRAATPYGRAIAERLAFDLARRGIAIVSGLARGIDACAHAGALAAGGRTVAVLPCGLERVTPAAHAPLAARIIASGALAGEVERGGPFGRGAFVRRNRLIAALSAVTVVVEAGESSGALATAAVARALGRRVLAVPADVDRPGSRGSLALLRAGAAPCADAGDVLAAMDGLGPGDASPEDRLLRALGREPRDLESLARESGEGPGETLARLLRLEWSGLALPQPGGRWTGRS